MQTTVENIKKVTPVKTVGFFQRAQIAKNLTFYIPAIILALLVLTAIFAPLLAPHDPTELNILATYKPPFFLEGGSTENLLGTDRLGRDVLSRLIYGSRISLSVSLIVIGICASLGTGLGILAGYVGGRLEAVLMRIVDVCMAFPGLLLAMLLVVSLGPGYWTVVLSLSVLGWAPYARLIRGETLKVRAMDFVAQARVNGATSSRIMLRHIFPNVVNPLIVIMTLGVGMIILAEAALSFLGIGIPPPNPTWGSMVSDGRSYLDVAWWVSAFPGIAIGLVVLSGNFLGDWLRDKLDPRLRQL
jgi:peptide/nickel transport system permease protein